MEKLKEMEKKIQEKLKRTSWRRRRRESNKMIKMNLCAWVGDIWRTEEEKKKYEEKREVKRREVKRREVKRREVKRREEKREKIIILR